MLFIASSQFVVITSHDVLTAQQKVQANAIPPSSVSTLTCLCFCSTGHAFVHSSFAYTASYVAPGYAKAVGHGLQVCHHGIVFSDV